MKKVIGKTKAWLGSYSSIELNNLSDVSIIDKLSFSVSDMSEHGWVFVGEADVEMNILDDNSILNNKISTLKLQKQKIQADAYIQSQEIDDEIQSLLSITFVEQDLLK